MTRRLGTFVTMAALLVCDAALAQSYGESVWRDLGRLKTSVACTESAANRTWTGIDGQQAGYTLGVFQLDYVHGDANSITWQCWGSLTSGSSWAPLQTCIVSSGQCQSTDASWLYSVSDDASIIWRVDMLGVPMVKCTFGCGGAANPNDTVTLYGRQSAQ